MKTYTVDEFLKPSNYFSHLLLENEVAVNSVTKTEKFLQDKNIEINVQFNGVEVAADMLEGLLDTWALQMEEHFQAKYEDQEAEVKKRVKQQVEDLLEDQITPMMTAFHSLQDKLSEVDSIVKYKWEK